MIYIQSNPLRKKLDKRARDHIALANNKTPAHLLKSPSQKRSEAGRRKYDRRAGIEKVVKIPIQSDCRGCTDSCTYDHNLTVCPKPSMVVRCNQCGQKVQIRLILGQVWEKCPICVERRS